MVNWKERLVLEDPILLMPRGQRMLTDRGVRKIHWSNPEERVGEPLAGFRGQRCEGRQTTEMKHGRSRLATDWRWRQTFAGPMEMSAKNWRRKKDGGYGQPA